MPTRIDTVHDKIVSELNIKINETLNTFDNVIAEKQKECEEGNVPNDGAPCESFIRNVRKKALSQFNGIKTWLATHILSTIIQQERTSGVYKLLETKEKITAAEAEKQKALEDRKRILENNNAMSDFEKYSLYGHPEVDIPTKSSSNRQNTLAQTKKTYPNIELAYRKYISKKKRSFILGLLVTIFCMAIDYKMIYDLFLSANSTFTSAMLSAVIIAAMLDAPPYVLGYVWTKNNDDRSLFELQGNADTSGAKRKIRGNKILLFIMSIVILLGFILYLLVRLLSFFGGGNINLAIHAILKIDFSEINTVTFSGADLLSSFVPLSTSVMALTVGRALYSMKTDYIKESIVVIKNEINEKIKICDEKIIEKEKQIKDLEETMVTLKKEIWVFYFGREPFPPDEESFRLEVSLAFQKLNLSLYRQTYSDCCQLLRDQAIALLGTVNDQLARYATDQPSIIAMSLSSDEERCLDDFWVIPTHGATQHQTTQSHLTSIENIVNELLSKLN